MGKTYSRSEYSYFGLERWIEGGRSKQYRTLKHAEEARYEDTPLGRMIIVKHFRTDMVGFFSNGDLIIPGMYYSTTDWRLMRKVQGVCISNTRVDGCERHLLTEHGWSKSPLRPMSPDRMYYWESATDTLRLLPKRIHYLSYFRLTEEEVQACPVVGSVLRVPFKDRLPKTRKTLVDPKAGDVYEYEGQLYAWCKQGDRLLSYPYFGHWEGSWAFADSTEATHEATSLAHRFALIDTMQAAKARVAFHWEEGKPSCKAA